MASVTYTCHPTQSLQLGGFIFEKSRMILEGERIKEFEALLKTLPPSLTSQIRKLSAESAAALAAVHASEGGAAVSGIVTTDSLRMAAEISKAKSAFALPTPAAPPSASTTE